MRRIQDFFKTYRWAILSGVLMGTSFIPFPPWAILFCYVPLWVTAIKSYRDAKHIFWQGWVTQFVLTLIGFNWIAYVSKEFGFMPWPIAIIVLFIFAATVHLYIPLALALGKWLQTKFDLNDFASLICIAALTTLGEIFWPSTFQWNLGYPWLGIQSKVAQISDIIGFQGLSFLMYLSSAHIAWMWLKKDKALWAIGGSFLILTLGFLHFWGHVKYKRWSQFDESIKVLQVQANIGNLERYYAEKGAGFQQFIINQYFDLTRQGIQKFPQSELIIWPESAFPDFLSRSELNRLYSSQFVNFVRSINKPVLTGGYSKDEPGKEPRKDYNGLFLFDQMGSLVAQPYHKTNLLVFGEYTPLSDTFPILKKISPAGEGFSKGSGPMTLPFNNIKLGTQICYESLYPEFTRQLVELGAQVLVNLTNDSWFGPTFEPKQHMYMTLARAVEARRPLIRNTNTGISTVILANGDILEQSPMYKPWFGLYDVQFKNNSETTLYTRFGAWLPAILLLIIGLGIFLGRERARSKASRLE